MSSAIRFLLALFLALPVLHAQTAVGADAPLQQLTLKLSAGTLAAIRVTTQGSENFDFTLAPGGTCTLQRTYFRGQTCTVLVAFHPLYPGERRGAVTLLPDSGPPLAQQLFSAQATGSVTTFLPATITTVAGNSAWIFAGDGSPATQTSIFLPFGLAVDTAGNLYLADSSNNRIRKVDAATGLVSTLAGTGSIGATGDNGPATLASLSNPTSIALDAAGNLYFADSGNNAIRRIDAVTGILTTVAGQLAAHGYTGDGGPATAATLNGPNGISLDATGNLYLADTANHVIRRVDTAGTITTVAGTGAPAFSGDSGPAIAATLNSPWSVTVAPTGELYIADQNNHRIRKVDSAGVITTIAGTGIPGFSGDKQPASLAQLNEPASVALDVAGNLYIADSGNNRIRKISARNANITTIAGVDGESFSGDLGPADQAGLYGPYTLALDSADNLYLADVFHNRIRKITNNAATLKFPSIRVGRVSSPLLQTLENDGNAPLTFSALTAVANSQIDAATTVCSLAIPLAPLDTCVTGVDFAPTVTGDPVLGKVALASDSGNSPGIVTPSGTVLDIDPTTLALSSTANPGLTGTTITFLVNATSAGTTPTGTVTFSDTFNQATTTLGTATLAAGSASVAVSTLTAGQHTITAAYSGDSSNAAATSTPLLETIKDAQATTLTTLTTSASPIDAGAPLTLTATVATRTTGAGSYPISGTVTFLEGSTPLGTATLDPTTATLDRATATLTLTTLAVGSHTLAAAYAGTPNDTASTSAPLTQLVHIATAALTLATSANPSPSGAPLTLTAHATSTGGVPSGPVNFYAGSILVGTAPLTPQGTATLALTSAAWAPGTYALTATYAGDPANTAVTSQAVTEVMVLATSTVALTSSLNPAGLGAQLTFTATVTGNGATPTGSVTFSDGTTLLGTAPLTATGLATFSTATLPVGLHSLTAAYSGDTNDAPATSPALPQQIDQTTIAITLATSKSPALFGDQITFTAAVTGSGSKPTGTVTFLDGATPLATLPLDPNGQAAYQTSALPVAIHTLTALYSGDPNHARITSAPVSESILQATTLTLQTSATRATAGLPVTLRAVLTGSSGQPTTGPIVLTDNSSPLATLTPDPTGLVTYSALLPAGTHTLTATYAGDPTNAPATSTPLTVTIDIATTTTALAVSANPSAFGSPLTLAATVTGTGATPTGSLAFRDGATLLGTVPVSASGTATLTLATLTPGIHPLTAAYLGDPSDQPSQSPVVSVQIALHTTLALTSSANPSLLTDSVTLTLTAANGTPSAPTGTVTLTDNGTPLTPIPLVNGVATLTLTSPTLGAHTLQATYPGDSSNGPATAQPLLQTVTLRPSTTSLTASSTALSAGQQLILISVVQAAGPRSATGSITFQSGATTLGTAAITPAGVATLTLTPTAATYGITAQYSGDTLYAPSTSSAIAVTVGPPVAFTLTPTPAALTLQTGQHASLTLALASNPTFHDTLAFGCAGLPADATCTFSTDRLAVTPGFPQTLTVSVDTGNPLGSGASASLTPLNPAAPLACILPAAALLAFLLRRKRTPIRLLALLLSLGLALGSVTGCGSSFAQSTTPAGAYAFQIVATGTTTTATQAATIQLTVTQ